MKGRGASLLRQATQRLCEWIPDSRFLRSAGILAGGTAAGQFVVVLASPVLTRLYTPDEFGVLAVFTALLGIVVVIASLRYQLAIPLPATDTAAANVLALGLAAVTGMAGVTFIATALLGEEIARWSNAPELTPYLWLLPLAVALGGAYEVFNYWAIRVKAFARIARTVLQQNSGKVITQIGLGLLQLGPLGLVIGEIVGRTAGLGHLVRMAWREDRALLGRLRRHRMAWAAKRFKGFALYSTGAGLSSSLGSQLPLLLFSALFSPAVAGLYILADRVLKAPVALMGRSVGQVFFSDAAEAKRSGDLAGVTLETLELLISISTGPLLVFAVLAPELFGITFGSDWFEAGVYAQLLAPMLLLRFSYSALSPISSVLEVERSSLIFQVSLLAARVLGLLIGAHLGDARMAVILFALGSCFVYLARMIWLFGEAGVSFRDWGSHLAREAVAVVPIVAFTLGVNLMVPYNSDTFLDAGNIVLLLVFVGALLLLSVWRVYPSVRALEI